MEDQITSLYDGILLHILSLLPMQDAVRTAILSSKYRYLGKFIPNLDFDSSNILGNRFPLVENSYKLDKDEKVVFFLERKLNFLRGIDQFLDLRPSGIKITSMRIHFSLDVDDAFHLNRWIKFAFSSGIEKLDIKLCENFYDIDLEKYYIFPFDLLSHEKVTYLSSLKSLMLESLIIKHHPNFSGFKSLTTLNLHLVEVSDDDLVKLLSTCPLLERIILWGLTLVNLEIPSSCCQLKYLQVYNDLELVNVSINAPNVTTFSYCGNLINFSFAQVALIKHIEFIFSGNCCEWIKYVFTKIPNLLPQLEFLELTCDDNIETESIPYWFPQFTNLKRLKLTQDTSSSYDLLWIIPLLRACPILQEIRFEFIPMDIDDTIYRGEVAKIEPSCYLKYLKVIEISGFSGFWNQIDLVSRLLKNSSILEIITINHLVELKRDEKYEKYDCDDNVKRWRRRINRFISKRVPLSTKLVIL